MEKETQPNETQPEGEDVTPAGGSDGGSEAEAKETGQAASMSEFSLEDINKALGKDFKTKDDALQSIREANTTLSQTQNELHQLKREREQGSTGNDDRIASLEREVRETQFYAKNPQLEPYKDLISSMGQDPREVVSDKSKKEVLDKLIAHDEQEKSKSVLMSNPRLGKVQDKISDARKSASEGDYAKAEQDAVEGVIDAFQL